MGVFAQYLRLIFLKSFITINECFKGAKVYLHFGLKVNDLYIYRARYNAEQCIASEPVKFLFNRDNICLNV